MPHLCGKASRIDDARKKHGYALDKCSMDPRQKPVDDWMREIISRRRISARAWAEKAGLGKDTVSRALRDDYEHVTSTRTISQLAHALGERPYGAAAAVPSEASLTAILDVLLEALMPERRVSPDLVAAFSASLRDTLLHLADEPDAACNPHTSRALARALARRQGPSNA